jgi:hypothetical protein
LRPLLVTLLLAVACATARRPAPTDAGPNAVSFAPEEPRRSAVDAELATKNDEELLAIGTAAYGAGEHARAAAAFARLADAFPTSRHARAAAFGAGLAYERLDEWHLALERFRGIASAEPGADGIEARFRVAECQYHLRELGDARATLDALAGRADLTAGDRVRALAERGIVELEDGNPEEADRTLRLAVEAYHAASERERLDPEHAAQAQFYLGEVHREWFGALPLDPSQGDEAVRRDLDHKSELLLSAQGHYLRTIRMGNDRWAIAAGIRIGELYDELRSQMLAAPLPPGVEGEAARTYRAELRRELRVLATKAIHAYEQTLARAASAGVDDVRFLADAQSALERLRRALADDSAPTM